MLRVRTAVMLFFITEPTAFAKRSNLLHTELVHNLLCKPIVVTPPLEWQHLIGIQLSELQQVDNMLWQNANLLWSCIADEHSGAVL